MSASFWTTLLFSLFITAGVFLLIYLYKYFLGRLNKDSVDFKKYPEISDLTQGQNKGEIQFQYELKQSEEVLVSLYDTKDVLVRSYVDEKEQAPGHYRVIIDTNQFEEGKYQLKIKTSFQEVMRPVVVG